MESCEFKIRIEGVKGSGKTDLLLRILNTKILQNISGFEVSEKLKNCKPQIYLVSDDYISIKRKYKIREAI